jgi:hypothetical protein
MFDMEGFGRQASTFALSATCQIAAATIVAPNEALVRPPIEVITPERAYLLGQ